jgi:signal transduction histidine kinase
MKNEIEEKLEMNEKRIDVMEQSYRAILDFIDKLENLSQFQDRLEIPANINQIWNAFLDDIKSIIRTNVCVLFLVDEKTHEFVLKNVSGDKRKKIYKEELKAQIECGIFSWIINRRKPAIIPSLVLDNKLSVIMMPLSTVKKTLGAVLLTTSVENQEITNESLQQLNMLARQCSLVIENSLLYKRLKEEQQYLNEARERTLQAEKLASLGQLTDGAFHEILNPLNIISGNIQILQKIEDLSPKVLKCLKSMKEQSERIAGIVNGLLQFSRHNEYEREKIDINSVMDGVINLLQYELNLNGINVVKKLFKKNTFIYGNEEQISQVFYNMIANSRDAMENGGTLEVITDITNGGDDSDKKNRFVEIKIRDTGCGIDGSDIDKIFDPFFTTKETGKGTGLGLSLSYGIIEDHGGNISVKSEEGKGTLFCIHFPVYDNN